MIQIKNEEWNFNANLLLLSPLCRSTTDVTIGIGHELPASPELVEGFGRKVSCKLWQPSVCVHLDTGDGLVSTRWVLNFD